MSKQQRISNWKNWKFLAKEYPKKYKVWCGRHARDENVFITALLVYRKYAFNVSWDIPYHWYICEFMKFNQEPV